MIRQPKLITRFARVAIAALYIAFLHGCGKEPAPVRHLPLEAIDDLAAEVDGTTSAILSWTTPESSLDTSLDEYDLRYSSGPLTDANFNLAVSIDGLPEPRPSGSTEVFRVMGLETDSNYYFGIRGRSSEGDTSTISNIAMATTAAGPDSIPPDAITNLIATDSTETSITFAWSAPGDDMRMGFVASFEIRSATSPITESNWEKASPEQAPLPTHVAAGSNQEAMVSVEPRKHSYFAIRASDEAGNAGPVGMSIRAGPKIVPYTFIVDQLAGPITSINAAIEKCLDGDEVLVRPGNYTEQVTFLGKALSLVSSDGPASTIIDGSSSNGPAIIVDNAGATTALIAGFTITGGTGYAANPGVGTRGGGIYFNGGKGVIRNNVITNNTASSFGGGLYCARIGAPDETLTVVGNVFDGNRGRNGGAIGIGGRTAVINYNAFVNNQAQYDGGAAFIDLGVNDILMNKNQFLSNEAGDHGGAIVISNGTGGRIMVTNSVFALNSALGADPGDTGSGGGVWISGGSGVVAGNTFVKNSGAGETVGSGGGLALYHTQASVDVQQNIFSENEGGGIACRFGIVGTLGSNMFWQNTPSEVTFNQGECPIEWMTSIIIADPRFCDLDGGIYAVSADSPAIQGEEVYGAIAEPGCQLSRSSLEFQAD